MGATDAIAIESNWAAEEVLALPDDGMRHELIRGELTTMAPSGLEHGEISVNLVLLISRYVRDHALGRTVVSDPGFKIDSGPDTVRAPDFAFIAQERVPETGLPPGYGMEAPDLAAEILSPHDRYTLVEEKVLDWLNAGTRMVLLINPRRRTLTVYRSPSEVRVFTEADEFDGDDVLPGFRCRVSDLFT